MRHRQGLDRARATKPDPFFLTDTPSRIRTGSFDDLADAATADWIIEAVVENLRREARARRAPRRGPRAAHHGLVQHVRHSDHLIAEGRSARFRRHWLGTHFFNPPRYLHLLEIIPTAEPIPRSSTRVAEFADHRLGKGVVRAKDTPNFIANHIGLFGVVRTLEALADGDLTIEEIDAITGPALGRPKSATFRTRDIAGIDVLGHGRAQPGDGACRMPTTGHWSCRRSSIA